MKPKCKLSGENGNIFNLVGKASKVLEEAGKAKETSEMCLRIFASNSYEEAISIIAEYVEVY